MGSIFGRAAIRGASALAAMGGASCAVAFAGGAVSEFGAHIAQQYAKPNAIPSDAFAEQRSGMAIVGELSAQAAAFARKAPLASVLPAQSLAAKVGGSVVAGILGQATSDGVVDPIRTPIALASTAVRGAMQGDISGPVSAKFGEIQQAVSKQGYLPTLAHAIEYTPARTLSAVDASIASVTGIAGTADLGKTAISAVGSAISTKATVESLPATPKGLADGALAVANTATNFIPSASLPKNYQTAFETVVAPLIRSADAMTPAVRDVVAASPLGKATAAAVASPLGQAAHTQRETGQRTGDATTALATAAVRTPLAQAPHIQYDAGQRTGEATAALAAAAVRTPLAQAPHIQYDAGQRTGDATAALAAAVASGRVTAASAATTINTAAGVASSALRQAVVPPPRTPAIAKPLATPHISATMPRDISTSGRPSFASILQQDRSAAQGLRSAGVTGGTAVSGSAMLTPSQAIAAATAAAGMATQQSQLR